MSLSRKPPLAPLPFAEHSAFADGDHRRYADRLGRVTSLNSFDPIGNVKDFNSKASVIHINGLKLVAGSNTPVYIETANAHDINLVIPFSGSVAQQVDGHTHHYGVDQGAMLVPATGRRARSTRGASMLMTLDPQRIQRVAQAMLGADASLPIDLRLQQARVLPWQQGPVGFQAIFGRLASLVDELHTQPDMLAQQGVDDVLYRQAVFMLRPDLFFSTTPHAPSQQSGSAMGRRIVDAAVAHIEHHLTERITLSDLERVSDASARQLQYAFMAKFACSPMTWIKQRRLDLAHARLQTAHPNTRIMQIALECGFHSHSAFSSAYQTAYGELPSQTMQKHAHQPSKP